MCSSDLTPYSHQEIIVRRELGLGDNVRITPSGGSLAADPMFSAGLERIGYAAKAIYDGGARRTLGHAFVFSLLFLGGLFSGLGILDNNLFRRWDTINRDKLGLED